MYFKGSVRGSRTLLYCYTKYAVAPSTSLYVVQNKKNWTKQKGDPCLWEKINCTISFQHMLLYILVLLSFSSLLVRGCELYCFQLVTHVGEEINREYEKKAGEKEHLWITVVQINKEPSWSYLWSIIAFIIWKYSFTFSLYKIFIKLKCLFW